MPNFFNTMIKATLCIATVGGLSNCTSVPAATLTQDDLLVGKWNCQTNGVVLDEELTLKFSGQSQETFTSTEWIGRGKMQITASTLTERASTSSREFGIKSRYQRHNQTINSIPQELNPIIVSEQKPSNEIESMLNAIFSMTNLSFLQDIKHQKSYTYDIIELTAQTLRFQSNDPELKPSEQARSTCTRAQ